MLPKPNAVLAALVAALASAAAAQDAVRLSPGHPDLASVPIEDHVLAVYDGGPGGQLLGSVTRTVTALSDGTVGVLTDANAPRAGLTSRDSAVYRPDLTPLVIAHDRGIAGRGRMAITGTNVSGEHRTRDQRTSSFDIDLSEVPFDPTSMLLIARSLPLEAGYTATVPTFSPISRVRDVTLTVVGEENVTGIDGESRMAWVIQEGHGTSGGRQEVSTSDLARRFFVDGETRELVQTTLALRRGVTITLVPATADQLGPAGDIASIQPGTAPLDVSRLTSYDRRYQIRIVEPTEQDFGTTSRQLTVDEDAGRATLVVTTELSMTAGVTVRDSSVAFWPSLRPISRTITRQGSRVEIVFSDGRLERTVSGSTVEPNETSTIELDSPAFDENWVGELVRTLPLEDGYRTSIRAVGLDGSLKQVLVSVEARQVAGRSDRVWTVRTTSDDGRELTYDIADSTREVLRMGRSPQVGLLIDIAPTSE
ncbi:MAG: hypothetical protein AAGK21_09210 [Bacteroidota bacterium]